MTMHPLNGASTGSVTKVLGPTEGTDYAGGVGSGQVLQDPTSDENNKFIFTGWPNAAANDRHLFVADINNALEVSNISKIVDASNFGRVDAAYGFYDKSQDRWLIGTGQNTDGLYVLEFSSDFSSYNAYNYGQDPQDCGANAFGSQTGDLFLSWVDQSSHNINIGKVTSDFTAASYGNLPTTLQGQKLVQFGAEYLRPDVHNTFFGVSGLTILQETWASDKQQWSLHPGFIGRADEASWTQLSMVSTQPLIQMSLQGGGDNYGHPHYTTQLGRPLLFFCWFKDLVSQQNTHEIWAIEPDYNVLKPQDWLPLRGRVSTGGAETTANFMTHGADKVVIWLDTGGNTGDLHIREAPSSKVMNSGAYYQDTKTISSASGSDARKKYVVSDPMYCMQFEATFGTNGIDVMLR